MSLLKKYAATHKPVENREVAYGKLLSYTGFSAVLVNGEPKERVSVRVAVEDHTLDFIMFKDSINGLPTFVPQGGVNMSITLAESPNEKDPANPWVNAIAMGVEA